MQTLGEEEQFSSWMDTLLCDQQSVKSPKSAALGLNVLLLHNSVIQYSLCICEKCFCCIQFYKLLRFTSWREHESVVVNTHRAQHRVQMTPTCVRHCYYQILRVLQSARLLLLSPARRQIISSGLAADGHMETNWWKSGIQKTFTSLALWDATQHDTTQRDAYGQTRNTVWCTNMDGYRHLLHYSNGNKWFFSNSGAKAKNLAARSGQR